MLAQIREIIHDHIPAPYPPDWIALKLLEGDEEVTEMARQHLDKSDWVQAHEILKAHEDSVIAIAGGRYDWIGRMVRAAVMRPHAGQITVTEHIDRIATHPVWGFMMLLGVLGVVFGITYGVGAPLQRWMNQDLVQAGADALRVALSGAPWWFVGLLTDGVVAGAGMVLTFLPILVVFFFLLGLFEEVGYMARAAYLMDRFMHWMGLHGKSFLPLCLSCGCNVPGVLCARIIESPRARILTILLTPLVPCTARLTALAVLTPLFFGSAAVWVATGVVGLNRAPAHGDRIRSPRTGAGGRACRLHHGNASLSHAERTHDRFVRLAPLPRVPEKGRRHHRCRLDSGLAPFGSSRRRFGDKLFSGYRTVLLPYRSLDGPGLAHDCGAVDQRPRQGKYHCHLGGAVSRKQSSRSCRLSHTGSSACVPCDAGDVCSVRGYHGGDPSGNEIVGVDSVQRGTDAGHFIGGGCGSVPGRPPAVGVPRLNSNRAQDV